MMASDALLWAQQNATSVDLVADFVENMFIIDYGIVKAVNSDDTVNVAHAKKLTLKTGEYLPEIVTQNLEVLWPSVGDFSFQSTLHEGDRVLLIGLKNYLKTVDIEESSEQTVYYAYSRETLKALPYCIFNTSAKIKVEVVDGDLEVDLGTGHMSLKTSAQGIKALIDELINDLTSMAAAIATSGSPLWPTGATAFPSLKAKYAQIFKE
jgi:hypothetical protein